MIIQENSNALQSAENTEEKYNLLTQHYRQGASIKDITDTVSALPLAADEKKELYRHLAEMWMERFNEQQDTVTRKAIEEYIRLSLLLEDTDRISFAAELTKNIGKINRITLFDYWRKELSEVKDYSKMIRFFCAADAVAHLDDNVMKELFYSYNYGVSDEEWKLLITTELNLKHVKLLERLYNVAGGAERFTELSGMSWEQLAEQLESTTNVSKIYMVSAYILAAKVRKAFDSEFSYTGQAERYVQYGGSVMANMTAYFAYNEFLSSGHISERLTELLSGLSPHYDTNIHHNVIRLNMRCIDKCIDEGLDIRSFLECTRNVNLFAKDSHLRSISWNEMLDISADGFGTEKAAAQANLDMLFDQISDKKLLVYIFLNTYYGAFCDMKDFIFALSDSGEDVAALFADHPLWGLVSNVDTRFRILTVNILRYNCSNMTIISPYFKGIIGRNDDLQIRITGIGTRKGGIRYIRSEIASIKQEYDEQAFISCIKDILSDIPDDFQDVKKMLWQVPHGWSYRYNSIFSCTFGFSKTYRLITACKELISAVAEKFDAESAINMYMNCFMRISIPLNVVCGILSEQHSASTEELALWLSEYQFDGMVKKGHDNDQEYFSPSAMLVEKPGLPIYQTVNENGRIYIEVTDSYSGIKLSASPAEDTERSDNPKYVHKFTEIRIKACSENIDIVLARKDIIDQACDQAFARNICGDLVKGLYLRLTKCSFKNRSAVMKFMNYFAAVNPFASSIDSGYREQSADKMYRKWQRIKPFVEDQYSHTAVFQNLLSLGLPYNDMCYIYLNSPLKYEIPVFDFLRKCIEGFITDNTAVPEFRLLGHRDAYGTIRIAEVCGDSGYPAVITNCVNVPESDWFSFLPEYRLDGSIALTDVKKYIQDPSSLQVMREEYTNTFPAVELKNRISEFFTDPAVRHSTDLYSVISGSSLSAHAYIGDCFGEYRIFARLGAFHTGEVAPLNVSTGENFVLESLGGFPIDKEKIYAMVPVFYRTDKKLLCVATAKYDDSTDIQWERCYTENDVPLPPTRISLGKNPYRMKLPNFTNQFIITNRNTTLENRIAAAMDCLMRGQLNLSKIVAQHSESEVNAALNGLILTYSSKQLSAFNFHFDKSAIVICRTSEEGDQKLSISNSGTDAILLLRFMRYEQKKFYFTIEKAYMHDPDISWHRISSEEDIPHSAKEIENIFSDEYDIIRSSQNVSVTE